MKTYMVDPISILVLLTLILGGTYTYVELEDRHQRKQLRKQQAHKTVKCPKGYTCIKNREVSFDAFNTDDRS